MRAQEDENNTPIGSGSGSDQPQEGRQSGNREAATGSDHEAGKLSGSADDTPLTSEESAPEAPVDGARLFTDSVAFIQRYVVLPSKSAAIAIGLWLFHTHAFAAAESTAYLFVHSPEKRSGKTRLLEVLELIVRVGWLTTLPSEAVVYRKIEKSTPTLLLDEVDAIFKTNSDRTEPLRAILNAGNRLGATVPRCVGPHHEVYDFAVFCPKALAGLTTRRFPVTIRDRSIQIRMRRRIDEPLERFRYRRARREGEELAVQIAAWVRQNEDALVSAEPELPDELDDRACDGWEPLLAIADLIGAELGKRARQAAIELAGDAEVEDETFGVQLLADLREIFEGEDCDENAFSSFLCSALNGLEERPWGGWSNGNGIKPRDLGRVLRPYGIKPKTVRRETGTAKGYQLDQFTDAWKRYLPDTDEEDE